MSFKERERKRYTGDYSIDKVFPILLTYPFSNIPKRFGWVPEAALLHRKDLENFQSLAC